MAKRKSKKSALLVSFGGRLRALRRRKKVSPSQFSVATGIDKETLRKYEDGELEPKLVVIMEMARALRVSHLDLLPVDIDNAS